MTDGLTGSRFKLGLRVVAEDRDRAFDGTARADNPMRERTRITVPVVTFDARVTEQFGIQTAVTVPDVTRTAVIPRPAGAWNYSETFQGLGDMSVLAWYRLRPVRRWNVVLNVGTSIPTGKTERPRFRPELEGGNLVPMSRLQRGSGTLDPLFGASVDRRYSRVIVFGSVAARVPIAENDDGLRTGASSEINAGVARALWTHRATGFIRLGWLHRAQDVFQGTPVLVGGGHWLYTTPGVAVQIGKGVNAQLEVKLPVYRALANKQLDSGAIFQFGVSRAF